MAEALVGIVIQPLLTKVISFADERISQVLKVKEDLESLAEKLELIQALLSDAESKSTTYKAAELWLQDLEHAAINADDLLDKFAYEVLSKEMLKGMDKVRNVLSLYPLRFRFKMVSNIKKIKQEINTIYEKGNLIKLSPSQMVNFPPTYPRDVPLTGSSVDESKIVGRKDEVKEIVGQLTCSMGEKNLAVIGIVGMAGQGKTTLAQLVMKDDEVERHFGKNKVWICVRKDFNADRVLEDMLKYLRPNLRASPHRDEIVKQLRRQFEGKRFLLVLDDIWSVDFQHWDSMINSLGVIGGPKESKIIVTTQNERVVTEMNGFIKRLGILSPADSQKLFDKIVFGKGGVPRTPHLERIGERIVSGCGGVPLALKLIASSMSSRGDDGEWQEIEKSIWSKLHGVRSAIKFSYDKLESLSLKQCFTYYSIFPKDSVIEKKILIQQWMAHGLLNRSRERELEMEQIGNNYFKILLERSLLQEAEFGKYDNIISCKMHDLMHKFVLEASKVHCLTAKVRELIGDIEAVHLSIIPDESDNLNISKKKFSRLRTLHLPANFSSKDFLVHCKCKHLRVLTLADEGVKELPTSIAKMKHLRYLDISMTGITALPKFISKLYHLQTLRLPFVQNLPEDFVRLVNLRYLYVNEEYVVIDLPKPPEMGQTKNVPNKDDCLELVGSHNNTEGSSNYESVLDHQPPLRLKYLKIVNYKVASLPSWIQQLHNLMSVELVNLDHCEKIPPLGHLPCLKILRIVRMNNIKFVDDDFYGWSNLNLVSAASSQTSTVVFRSLKELTFIGMSSLEEWRRKAQPSSVSSSPVLLFPGLEKLEISFCPKLNCLPRDLLSASTGLESLHIQSCEKLSIPDLSSLNSLKYLHISSCGKLSHGIDTSRSVQTLDITCPASVAESLLHHLTNLRELTLRLPPEEPISNTTRDGIQVPA